MGCDRTIEWIWESPHPQDPPPADVAEHLAGCASCGGEMEARVAVGRDLRGLRASLEGETSDELDARVLAASSAAVTARESGRFPISAEQLDAEDTPDDIADQLADSIAEDFGEHFAAVTTGRLRVRKDEAPKPPRALAPEPAPAPTPAPPPTSRWQAPRATPQWMLAATLLLGAALSIGYSVGRQSTKWHPVPGAAVHTTIATTATGVVLSQGHRAHSVGLSHDGVSALADGNTYLMAGPVGGPYQVVGVVNWGQVDTTTIPVVDRGEIVVAVGPAGGWSRGKELAMNDLAGLDVEILGRRALPRSR